MEMNTLGNTGLRVSRLGIGLAEIGIQMTRGEGSEAVRVLNMALDNGINFLDTAGCYGISEELIGNSISHRRDEYILATKCGHVTGDCQGESWTAQTIRESIDRSLERMKTDYLDLVQLHSCSLDILEKGEAAEALSEAQKTGKTRFVGFSGDNESANWAIESGLFDTLQTTFNLVDQRARIKLFPRAESKGMGIIIKRPIANAAWGAQFAPIYGASSSADEYFQRAKAMSRLGSIPGAPADRIQLALGFVFAHREVDTAIVGTRNSVHLQTNIGEVEKGINLTTQTIEELNSRFEEMDDDWVQLT